MTSPPRWPPTRDRRAGYSPRTPLRPAYGSSHSSGTRRGSRRSHGSPAGTRASTRRRTSRPPALPKRRRSRRLRRTRTSPSSRRLLSLLVAPERRHPGVAGLALPAVPQPAAAQRHDDAVLHGIVVREAVQSAAHGAAQPPV